MIGVKLVKFISFIYLYLEWNNWKIGKKGRDTDLINNARFTIIGHGQTNLSEHLKTDFDTRDINNLLESCPKFDLFSLTLCPRIGHNSVSFP